MQDCVIGRPLVVAVAATFFSLIVASSARAELRYKLIAITGSGGINTIDPASGKVISGPKRTSDDLIGITARSNGRLFSISEEFAPSGSLLSFFVELSLDAAAPGRSVFLGFDGPYRYDLDFDPTNEGLYVLGALSSNQYRLNRIDPQTGLSLPGETVIQGITRPTNTSTPSIAAMAFRSDGALYLLSSQTNTLFKVDKTSGSLLSTVPLSGPSLLSGSLAGMDFDPQTGTLYVIAPTPTAVPSQTGNLYTLDPDTGALALIGTSERNFNPHGLTFVLVPEPATIVVVGSGILIAGTTLRRKRGFAGQL